MTVWEGIRRTHGAPPDQAAPLMPPELLDVLEACLHGSPKSPSPTSASLVYDGPDVAAALDCVRGFTCTSEVLQRLDPAAAARAIGGARRSPRA
jgi:hypothetical protein